uniref:IMD domain-containing protein n=1 Tax=Parastrongyloides trichosuri TaxID=131310 RepID=A0A0N4Z988_PARTI
MTSLANNMKFLKESLDIMSKISEYAIKQSECFQKGGKSMTKWASTSNITAINDVMEKTYECYSVFSDRLVQFAKEYENSLKSFRKIDVFENIIKDAEKKLNNIIEEEKKKEKEIKKYNKSSKSLFKTKARKHVDLSNMENDLKKIRNKKDIARNELTKLIPEMEVNKMFIFREGMGRMADAWKNLAIDMVSIFSCKQELVENVPAVTTMDASKVKYEGKEQTELIVNDFKGKLKASKSCTDNFITTNKKNKFDESTLVPSAPECELNFINNKQNLFSYKSEFNCSETGNFIMEQSTLLVKRPSIEKRSRFRVYPTMKKNVSNLTIDYSSTNTLR